MPVLLESGSSEPVLLGAAGVAVADFSDARSIEIALVNNMPDAALESTERQFVHLLAASSGDQLVRVRRFALPGVARSGLRAPDRAAPLAQLLGGRVDGLIVTGAEPRAAFLPDEPYWDGLCALVDWSATQTHAAIWSCLAAHAAVLHTDGIRRRPLADKCFGIFDCAATGQDPLLAGVPARFAVPHSRRNDLDGGELAAAGYAILSRAPDAGVDAFVKRSARSTFLFFQGHPEYDADTLYREYRRDVARYLRGEREAYPNLPAGYFSRPARELMATFRARAEGLRDDSLMADFPITPSALRNTWQTPAIRIYRNWLAAIVARKSARSRPVGVTCRAVAAPSPEPAAALTPGRRP